MSDAPAEPLRPPAVFTIPTHRSFADSLVAGLIERSGSDPLRLARGRILLPNNRAVRTVTEAFVRASRGGLLLPRLIPIGDPELDERIGGALDLADDADPVPPAIDPLERLLELTRIVRADGESAAEAVRLAADLARTLDALAIEEVDPAALAGAVDEAPDLATHWQRALARLHGVLERWPALLAARGRIDLTERRNRLLRGLAERWRTLPPAGFTIAAGVATSAPAVAALLGRVARLPDGAVVLSGLNLADAMPNEEWEALGPDEHGRGEETHPQYHLKLLLDRIGVARAEVRTWRAAGRASSAPARTRSVANAMSAAEFSAKWRPESGVASAERRLPGIRLAELADPHAEAQAIALSLRRAIEEPGRTAALVTPDRMLAERVSALLQRWGIDADDSAGRALSHLPAGTLLLGIASAAAEDLAPVPLLALLKHPLVGGEGEQRLKWLDQVRTLDLCLRGPRPAAGIGGLDAHVAALEKDRRHRGCSSAWAALREPLRALEPLGKAQSLSQFAERLVEAVDALAGERAWSGADGRAAAELIGDIAASAAAAEVEIAPEDALPTLRQLLDTVRLRPPYGGHPRVFIWGLLEARLQHADLMVLGGLNEGAWPALPQPDPWLAPKIRANLGLPGLEFRIGLSAHDFASALGAPEVLITRARRDSRSPTVASRFWLRLEAMTGGLEHDATIEQLANALDTPERVRPADRPAPCPPAEQRPHKISVTRVDRLKADPFAFYAQSMLRLQSLDPPDADHTAAWRGSAVHELFEHWLQQDECDPGKLRARAEQLLSADTIHPMLRALWQPRLMAAIDWMAEVEAANQAGGRRPLKAEVDGEAQVEGVTLYGRADRIDCLPGGGLAIIDYKTGKAPAPKAVAAGFSLQLGLLGLIAEQGGFGEIAGDPRAFEYWSLAKNGDGFGKVVQPDKKLGPDAFLDHARENFREAVHKWLLGDEPFTAKLNPGYAPYGDYDQLMRLEEWYGRR